MQAMRLIIDPPASPACNMGIDEALLESVGAGRIATLRFYRWQPAAVSLGYFQPIDAYEQWRAEFTAEGGCATLAHDLVRRATGGGAILHADELTYSLAVPGDLPAIAGQPNRLYSLAHQAIATGLNALGISSGFYAGPCDGNAQRGPFFCFARRHCYDLVVGAVKIVGSAQRRRRGNGGAILQHGSIILRQVGPQPCVGVNDLRASPVRAEELADLLVDRFADVLSARFERTSLSDEESARAGEIATKYASAEWTRQR